MLSKKLQIKPGHRFIILNAPENMKKLPGEIPEKVKQEKKFEGYFDVILLFATMKKELEQQWKKIIPAMKQEGILWIAYPKKSSGVASDLAMMGGSWSVYENSPWQPVSTISIDDTWTGVRFKNAPTLNKERTERSSENIYDNDQTLCVDLKNRMIHPSKDLKKLLDKNQKARSFFETLSFTNKKEFVLWIIQAKRIETRQQRLKDTIEKLMTGKKNPSEK